jgi:hypothetical protein
MNKISPAQRAFFERTVREMEIDPYDKWTSLWKRAPDATLLDNTKFDQTVADRYDLLDVFFWSPSRLKAWKKLGVEMPCARHGFNHADKVTVKQRWAFRLVKGVFFDSILARSAFARSAARSTTKSISTILRRSLLMRTSRSSVNSRQRWMPRRTTG